MKVINALYGESRRRMHLTSLQVKLDKNWARREIER